MQTMVSDHRKHRDSAKRVEPRHLSLQKRGMERRGSGGETSVVGSEGPGVRIRLSIHWNRAILESKEVPLSVVGAEGWPSV